MLIIVIFSIFFVNIFRLSADSLNYEIIRHNSSELSHAATQFGATVSSVSDTVISAYIDKSLLGLRLDSLLDAYDIYLASQFLSELVFRDDNHIVDIFLYSANSDIVITSNGSFVKQQFLRYSYYNPAYGAEFWDDLSRSEPFFDLLPVKSFTRNDFPQTRDMHLLPIAFRARLTDEYILVAFMDVKQIFARLGMDESYIIYLFNGDTILYPVAKDVFAADIVFPAGARHIQNESTFYFREFVYARNSSHNQFVDLHFIRLIEYSEMAVRLQNQQNMYWILMLLVLFISLFVSFVLASTISSPIKKILRSLSQDAQTRRGSNIKEFDMIGQLTEQLISDNKNYGLLLNKKNVLLRNYYYQMRLKNLHLSDENGEDLKEFFPEKGRFQLAYFVLHYTPKFNQSMNSNFSQATFALSEYFQLLLHMRYPGTITMPVEDTRIISIILLDDDEGIDEFMTELLKTMENEHDYVYTTMIIGRPFNEIEQLNDAYNDLHELAKYEYANKKSQLITASNATGDIFYFPQEQEQVLINLLSKGSTKDAVSIVRQIFSQNAKRNVTLYYYRKLVEQIARHCKKILADKNLQFPDSIESVKLTKQLEYSYNLDDLANIAIQHVENTCAITGYNKDKKDPIITFVCDYMEEHFAEDIYLDLLSELLGITSNYLSHYFKKKTGISFSSYLTGIRMKKAKEMLIETKMSINEISTAVCFLHTNSFIRMFKKTTGQTPGEFRKLHSAAAPNTNLQSKLH